jgi:hypothetical protein
VSLEYPDNNCLWRNLSAPPYAFSMAMSDLEVAEDPLPLDDLRGVNYLGRVPEHIWLIASPLPDQQLVVMAQDVAYPGWIVKVDGQPAQLESVGGILGVVLPAGDTPVMVEFIYTAPTFRLGAAITLLTAFVSIGYLLQLDKLRVANLRRWRSRIAQGLPGLQRGTVTPPLDMPTPAQPVYSSVIPHRPPPVSGVPMGVSASVEGEAITPAVHVAAEHTIIRIIVPPSNRPTQVEVAVPTFAHSSNGNGNGNQKDQRGLLALVGMAMMMLFWLATDRKPRK